MSNKKNSSSEVIAVMTAEEQPGTFEQLVREFETSRNNKEFKERFARIVTFADKYQPQIRELRLRYVKGLAVNLLKSGMKKKDLANEIGSLLSVTSEMARHYLTAAIAAKQNNVTIDEIQDVVKFAKSYTVELNEFGDKITGKDGFPLYVPKPKKKELTEREKLQAMVEKFNNQLASLKKLRVEISELRKLLPEETEETPKVTAIEALKDW